jgi:hypothetical protein
VAYRRSRSNTCNNTVPDIVEMPASRHWAR